MIISATSAYKHTQNLESYMRSRGLTRDTEPVPHFPGTEDAALVQLDRLLSTQMDRLAVLRQSAGLLLGASGIAAALVTSDSPSAATAAAAFAFLVSAGLSLGAILPGASRRTDPARLVEAMASKPALQYKIDLCGLLASEYLALESFGKRRLWYVRASAGTFLVGLFGTALAAF